MAFFTHLKKLSWFIAMFLKNEIFIVRNFLTGSLWEKKMYTTEINVIRVSFVVTASRIKFTLISEGVYRARAGADDNETRSQGAGVCVGHD